MALVSMRQLLDHAAEHGYGLPAFNINNMEQIRAIMLAAHECDSPVILQASAGARKYTGEAFLRHMVEAAVETWPHIPIVLHQDHGASPAVCQRSIRSGFTSVMMDGSLKEDMKTPASYEYNVAVTRQVVEMAHAVGVSVEGELGVLGSLETGQAGEEDGSGAEGTFSHDDLLTNPDQAADFVVDQPFGLGRDHLVVRLEVDVAQRVGEAARGDHAVCELGCLLDVTGCAIGYVVGAEDDLFGHLAAHADL